MAFSLSALFRRNKKAVDPFGADDDEEFYDDEEPEGRSVGHMVAYGLSGLMGLLLVGFIATAIMTADETAGPVTGMIPTEISEVVSEDGEVLQTFDTATSNTASSAPDTQSNVVALPGLSDVVEDSQAPSQTAVPRQPANGQVLTDSTAETDRSAARRPWLVTESNDGERLGENATAPDAAVPGSSRSQSMADLLRQSREGTPSSTTTALPPPPGQTAAQRPTQPSPMPQNELDDSMAGENTTSVPMDLVRQADGTEQPTEQTQASTEPAEATPLALPDPGLVPGAPRRQVQNTLGAGPAAVGGAPRLSEPELPPTDSRAVSAAPPRFTTLPKAEELAALPDAEARVAIIVEGLGLNRSATEAAIETLPANITLSFSPYSRDLQDWLQKAIEAGHEVLVEVPMESKRFPADDPGPLGLLTSLDQIQNVERLSTILEEANGSAGVLDVTGSRFRESSEHINILFNNLDARGLFYVQGRPGLRLGTDKVPTATADIVLDERAFRASIDARLDFIERLAKYQGSSVAVASAKPVTFERIALWLDEAGRRGVSVAPVSQVLIQ